MIHRIYEFLYTERKIIIMILIIIALFFGINIYLSFATDTYSTFFMGFDWASQDMLTRNGRPIIAIIYKLQAISGLPNIAFYYISSVFALVFLFFSIYIYQRLLSEFVDNNNIRILLSFISIANIFINEYFMFIEKCGFLLAILFNILGIAFITFFYRKKKPVYIFISAMFVLLAIFTYQGTIALFVILALPFACKYAENIKSYIINLITTVAVYGLSLIIDLFVLRLLLQSTRVAEHANYWMNFQVVVKHLKFMLVNTFQVLPKHYFQIILCLTIILCIINLIIVKDNRLIRSINLLLIIVCSYILPAASIVQGSAWFVMRIVYPMASVFGVLMVEYFINVHEAKFKLHKYLNVAAVMLILILLVGQYLSFNKIFIDKLKVNFADTYRILYIYQAISEYEEESGERIAKIAFYKDANPVSPYYPGLYSDGDLVVSALYQEWSDIHVINYYLGTDYQKVECDEEYTEYFEGCEWWQFSKEQLIFEGDTLHLCMY